MGVHSEFMDEVLQKLVDCRLDRFQDAGEEIGGPSWRIYYFRKHGCSTRTQINMALRAGRALDVILRNSRSLPSVIPIANYHEKVIDHYEHPRNVGSLDKNDPNVGTGIVGAPACGDVMKLQIKVDDNGKIIDAKFKTFGCGSAIASSSLASEWIKGKTTEYASKVKNTEIAQELCLPPVKLHCSMLAEDAIQAALKDYRKKQAKRKTASGAS
ncbi:hypothetical protein AB6A40_003715 [Gnathostoma spinigerum]|uniref:Iron-sulfur cluster assembly enzyme ISCU n=1 Tax=Gnathostoma spinigerum TaxID=75299 RepID=A0ABD6EHZ1_9BILA